MIFTVKKFIKSEEQCDIESIDQRKKLITFSEPPPANSTLKISAKKLFLIL